MTDHPNRRTILALLLVPVLAAGALLLGTWGTGDRLRTVEAAVVNLDRMVTMNGQAMPLGRQLAAELVDSSRDQNLTWVLANEEGAREGLEAGRFAAVVTIPEDFSATATSFAGDPGEAGQATIAVETSAVIGINETALGQSIADCAASALNRFLTGEYLKGIYLGFNDLNAQFVELRDGTAQLADGAGQLADGTGQSAAGADELADGLGAASAGGGTLRDGADQSSDGARQLAGGAGALTAGASELAGGAGEIASGAGLYADGATRFADGTALFTGGVADLADGATQYADGVTRYADGVHLYADGTTQYADGAALFADGTRTYVDGVAQYVGVVNPVIVQLRDLVALLPAWDEWIDDAMAWVEDLPEWAIELDTTVQEFVADLTAFLERVRDLIAGGRALDEAIAEHRDALAGTSLPCPADLTAEACEAFAAGVAAANGAALADAEDLVARSAEWTADADRVLETIDALIAAAGRLAELSAEFARIAPELQEELLSLAGQFPSGTFPTQAELLDLLDQFIAGGDQLVSGGEDLSDGAAGLAAGADQLVTGADQLAEGADQLAAGAARLAAGATRLAAGGAPLAEGAEELASGAGELAAGAGQLGTGAGTFAAGVDEFGDGVGRLAGGLATLADGVAVYTYGIDRAATGSAALADGLGELAGGAHELSAGVGELAAGVAAGAGEIPTYTDAERENLARAAASPIDTTALGGLVLPRVSWASLLLVLALWLGALAIWTIVRPIDRRNAYSTDANGTLLWRSLRPGLAIAAAQALVVGVLGAVVVGLSPGRSLGLVAVLLVAGAAFAAVCHALIGVFGTGGRIAALAMLLVTAVPAVTSTAPGVFDALRPLSPLSPALDAVRAVMTGGSPVLPLLLLATWLTVAIGTSAVGVARSRTIPLRAVLAQPVG